MFHQGEQFHLGYRPDTQSSERPPSFAELYSRNQHTVIGRVSQEIPITGRSADILAVLYGYGNLDSLIADIPPNGEVADVGSGASTLGWVVAGRRPDIHWVNVDLAYADPERKKALQADSPPNLEFDSTDALHLTEEIGEGRFDRVYSYFLLRHIQLAGNSYARNAARQLLLAAKPDGKVIVGPVRRKFVNVDEEYVDVGDETLRGDALKLDRPTDEAQITKAARLVTRASVITPFGIRQRLLNGWHLNRHSTTPA